MQPNWPSADAPFVQKYVDLSTESTLKKSHVDESKAAVITPAKGWVIWTKSNIAIFS